MTISQTTYPLYVRCALEVFALSGARTKARLRELLDFYFRSAGEPLGSERSAVENTAIVFAKNYWSLGAAEGF
ncbi:hypothetical protein [Paraburkholderia humisilvae]|uniref:Uncharacterized protein n=1 Tax=Paraburkholderia humisilvae TaxID=627669 RepID=A0A6J5DKQ1_9BURK|nr:hypothetical protein [Paraburkholderia humisilvae]CAB3754543.1 hypothetical protein LMG29542_02379 [Paraburkholderia humisilvae]